jgi:hypothetical protein
MDAEGLAGDDSRTGWIVLGDERGMVSVTVVARWPTSQELLSSATLA